MPGIDGRGLIRISPYSLWVDTLGRLKEIMAERKYDVENIPSKGFTGIPNEEGVAKLEVRHLESKIFYLPARFSFDFENRNLKKKAASIEEFRSLPLYMQYIQSHYDMISYTEGTSGTVALVSTTRQDGLITFENLCLNDPCFTDPGITYQELPQEFNVGADLLLWLLYRNMEENGSITDGIKIPDIEGYHSESEHSITYSGRSSQALPELVVSIVKKRPILTLKIHLEILNDAYAFVLHHDGRTEISPNQTVAHEEITDRVDRRELIILDIYNRCIPILKKAYSEDKAWSSKREKFRENLKKRISKEFGL
jgi:hypothetical protein